MDIRISECNSSPNRLFCLLAEYDRIDKLVKDVLDGKLNPPYLEFAIKFDGQLHWLIDFGKTNKDFPLSKLKKISSQYRKIPNDFMIVRCDEFERELFIDLDNFYIA